ncbi:MULTISPECIES: cyclopropane-fatty-acyl-phospholipid synthase family protein [unclassified Streptomyces]|uniref:cyclopropane-fatty-acyl-phospholipid synthase family protein n=1 Tax=unclassified Streptomyces TaxID=2593676 RepID=UPI0034120CA4
MTTTTTGATATDIEFHYDVGNDFYALWLDDTLTYSAALWDGIEEDGSHPDVLAQAQRAKLRHHLDQAALPPGGRLLDIGCGWGALLALACEEGRAGTATGLTLSRAQLAHVQGCNLPGVQARLEDWRSHVPECPYDAIVSIEAFEAFAGPGLTTAERVGAYTDFFTACHSWLAPGGTLSLQTIAFDAGVDAGGPVGAFFASDVFPASALPRLTEITAACDAHFSLTAVKGEPRDYIRTLRAWSARLRTERDNAQRAVGADTYQRYRLYLKTCEVLFHRGEVTLYRMSMRRRPKPLHLPM